jgi:hypothetical protein
MTPDLTDESSLPDTLRPLTFAIDDDDLRCILSLCSTSDTEPHSLPLASIT